MLQRQIRCRRARTEPEPTDHRMDYRKNRLIPDPRGNHALPTARHRGIRCPFHLGLARIVSRRYISTTSDGTSGFYRCNLPATLSNVVGEFTYTFPGVEVFEVCELVLRPAYVAHKYVWSVPFYS